MDMMNYEDAVEFALLDGLKQKFNIAETSQLVKYLFARCAVLHGVDSVKDSSQFMNFLLQELCITYVDPECGSKVIIFHYDQQDIMVENGFSNCNSLFNIFDSIESEFLNGTFVNKNGEAIDSYAYIKSMVADIQKRSNQKLKPYKRSHYKNELQTLFKLQLVNEDFCIKTPVEAPHLSVFTQRESRMSIDTLYERYLHAENFDTTNVHSVTEAQVRDYLYMRLDLIEDGLKPIMKEFPTKEGRVDIVARDKEGNLVVIELKTENDKRLIWQCMYYPDEVKKGLGAYDEDKKVRMLTIAPEYPEYIKKPLEKLGYVESYTYTIKAFNNVIEEVNVEKFHIESKGEKTETNDTELDGEAKDKLNLLINAFVYTRKTIDENDGLGMNDRDLNEVSLKLVEMVWSAKGMTKEN